MSLTHHRHLPRWLSMTDYAAAYGVSRKTVAKWLTAGEILTAFKAGRVIRVLDVEPGMPPPPDVVLQDPSAYVPVPRPAAPAPSPLPPVPLAAPLVMPEIPQPRRQVRRAAPVRIGQVAVPTCAGVYVVRQGIAAKIGFAKNLQRRLTHLQIAHPAPLIVVGYIETPTVRDAQQLEHRLHRQFADERIRGEWFRLTSTVVDVLQAEGHWHAPALLVNVRQQG